MNKKLPLIFAFFFSFFAYSQSKFQFYGEKNKKQTLKFKLINNLIVIPLEINGKELSFILDTGVTKTVLFNLTANDSIGLNNVEKIKIRGLGNGAPVEALLSKNNSFKIANMKNPNESLYVVFKDAFDLSARMGTTIHGIVGYDFFKDVIVKINYSSKVLSLYNPLYYKQKKCKSCVEFPLELHRNKPYINVKAKLDSIESNLTNLKLLIDTGGSDAMWLFENSIDNIKTPKKYFDDILGEGFSGTIYGKRSKIPQLFLGKHIIKQPTVSFLDSSSTIHARKFKDRNGSIGSGLLKRFKVWIDYPNKKLILKKQSSLKKGFYYNMSGLQIIYNGQELIREKVDKIVNDSYGNSSDTNGSKTVSLITTYHYKFKPSFKISNVLPNSPAGKAGLKENDIILKVNGKPAYEYTLNSITSMFFSNPNKKIRLVVKRGITKLKYEFRLEKRI